MAFVKLTWLNFFAVTVEKNVARYFAAISPTNIVKKRTKPASVVPSKAHRSREYYLLPSASRLESYKYK